MNGVTANLLCNHRYERPYLHKPVMKGGLLVVDLGMWVEHRDSPQEQA